MKRKKEQHEFERSVEYLNNPCKKAHLLLVAIAGGLV